MNAFLYLPRTVRHWFSDGVLRRTFKNAGMLLTGRATNGLLSLATLSLMAHSLGIEWFGMIVLVQTYVLVLIAFATFQSWQAVIRYGAICLEQNNTPALQSLIKFSALLDMVGVIFAFCLGYFLAPVIGPYMDWTPEVIRYAQLYSVLILFTMIATPTGILRLCDRFDLLAMQTVLTPLLRLVGVAGVALLDGPFWAYLAAWFVAGAAGGSLLVYLGWREAFRRGFLTGITWSFKGITKDHPGIVRFSVISTLHASVQIIPSQMSTFIVGLVAGPAAAGLFKVGRDVATALSKPAELLNQSIYPEFARLGSRDSWADFTRLILRGGAMGAGAGVMLLVVALALGRPFLTVVFGAEFAEAYWPLVILIASAGLTICGFPMDPALFAMGRPGIALRIGTVVIIVFYLPLLVVLTEMYGATGAAAATLIAALMTLVSMSAFTAAQLRRQAASV
jgi:O-antigen/teichoic acid export membrane protein